MPGEIAESGYRLSEGMLERALRDAQTLPFLIQYQIFRMRETDGLRKHELEMLEAYFKTPVRTTYLIFEAEALSAKQGLAELMQQHAQVFILKDDLKKSLGTKLIRDKLKRHGKTIEDEARMHLENQMGGSPGMLDSVLDQLVLYAADKKEITAQMVESFEENWAPADVFKLTNAIIDRKRSDALMFLTELLSSDQEMGSVLGVLHWQLRRFWKGKVLLEEGLSEDAMLKKCGVSPRQAHFFLRQIRNLSRERLEKALQQLLELDCRQKTGQAEGTELLEAWAIRVTS